MRPSWLAAQSSSEQTLFVYCANRTAHARAFDGTVGDPLTVNLRVRLGTMLSQRGPVWKTCTIMITEEDGQLWIRPEFLATSFSADPFEPPAEDAIITP